MAAYPAGPGNEGDGGGDEDDEGGVDGDEGVAVVGEDPAELLDLPRARRGGMDETQAAVGWPGDAER